MRWAVVRPIGVSSLLPSGVRFLQSSNPATDRCFVISPRTANHRRTWNISPLRKLLHAPHRKAGDGGNVHGPNPFRLRHAYLTGRWLDLSRVRIGADDTCPDAGGIANDSGIDRESVRGCTQARARMFRTVIACHAPPRGERLRVRSAHRQSPGRLSRPWPVSAG
jgi:hypothetical protein